MTTGLDDAMYWLTVQQRDAAWREVEVWKQRYEMLLNTMADTIHLQHSPKINPMMLAEKESYEAGRIKGQMDLAEHLREEIAQLVEAMGIQGYGTLAIAAAIRSGKA